VEERLEKGPEHLKQEVIETGWCVSCGACVNLCPYIKKVEDRVAVVQSCGLNQGDCYMVCPRTYTDYQYLQEIVTGKPREAALGSYRKAFLVRAAGEKMRDSAQYGGAVTALATWMIESGLSSRVLVTGATGLIPRSYLAGTEEEIYAAGGSKYTVCPGLAEMNSEMVREEGGEISVVGRPCQVVALRKMQHISNVKGRHRLAVIIGLFCFWGLDYSIYRHLQHQGVSRINRADIPRDEGLTLETDRGKFNLNLEETRGLVRQGCHSCIDPTSELADVSVGSTEHDSKWCTLLVRTAKGEDLVNKALSAGYLETQPYPEEWKKELKEAARNKKIRVLQPEAEPQPEVKINNEYLALDRENIEQLREGY